ncbi:hypothetical protein H310_14784 [Aphanomyces invadans]|uniref:Uncharacterized protein n=1 Tax=Aphanomyces invadans TaxID=157072 RepID=A0A024T8U5_9STRA|nr:hypothetical protein H310_14784 [Aphanomyces invadans]ETV90433.1 hypothetical protein H310_14784 [Aphanomyces invadans]|eukprot:XP_008880935.1 hypothetical protein H310_14784 [Aphanomyces invadans]
MLISSSGRCNLAAFKYRNFKDARQSIQTFFTSVQVGN